MKHRHVTFLAGGVCGFALAIALCGDGGVSATESPKPCEIQTEGLAVEIGAGRCAVRADEGRWIASAEIANRSETRLLAVTGLATCAKGSGNFRVVGQRTAERGQVTAYRDFDNMVLTPGETAPFSLTVERRSPQSAEGCSIRLDGHVDAAAATR